MDLNMRGPSLTQGSSLICLIYSNKHKRHTYALESTHKTRIDSQNETHKTRVFTKTMTNPSKKKKKENDI